MIAAQALEHFWITKKGKLSDPRTLTDIMYTFRK
jgi:hypothetical protein